MDGHNLLICASVEGESKLNGFHNKALFITYAAFEDKNPAMHIFVFEDIG